VPHYLSPVRVETSFWAPDRGLVVGLMLVVGLIR